MTGVNSRPEMPREVRTTCAEMLRELFLCRACGSGGPLTRREVEERRRGPPQGARSRGAGAALVSALRTGGGGFQTYPWADSWGARPSTASAEGWGPDSLAVSPAEPQHLGAPRKGFVQGRGSEGAGGGGCAFWPL